MEEAATFRIWLQLSRLDFQYKKWLCRNDIFRAWKGEIIMNKLLALAVALLFSALQIANAYAGSNDTAVPPTGHGQVQKSGKGGGNAPVAGKKPGYSVAKDYDKRVAKKNQAIEQRKKLIQEGK
jgi:hypothetical protein